MSGQPVRNFTRIAAAIVAAAIVISAAALSYSSFEATVTKTVSTGTGSTSIGTSTVTTTSTLVSTKTITTSNLTTVGTSGPKGAVFLMSLNGSYYWADDVSSDIVIGWPGYSYFLNGSVTFDGVKFQTICPVNYLGCPGSNSPATMIWANAISFSVTFPGNTTEQVGYAGLGTYTYVLSQDSPKAGMLIEYTGDYNYPNSTTDFAVFLLVSSCGSPPNLC